MKNRNGLFLLLSFLICFGARGQAPADSLKVRVPDILLDSADYGFTVQGFDLIAYGGRLSFNKEGAPVWDKRIILAGRNGDVRQVIEIQKLGKKFAKDWRKGAVLNISLSGKEKKMYVLMRDMGTLTPEYLLIYDLKESQGRFVRLKLKLKGKHYKILSSGAGFFYDEKSREFYIPVIERKKLEGLYRECPEFFRDQHSLGVFSSSGRLLRLMAPYSRLYREGPCLYDFRYVSLSADKEERVLGIQEMLNPQLRFFDLDTGLPLTGDTTKARAVEIFTSRKEELLWPLHDYLVNPLYYDLRYDSLNSLWLREYKPPLPDTLKKADPEFEYFIDEYLAGRIKSCPAVSPEKEERQARLQNAPRFYQLLNRNGEIMGQLKWKNAGYYASEKGAIWLMHSKNWKEKGYFMIYRFPLEAFR